MLVTGPVTKAGIERSRHKQPKVQGTRLISGSGSYVFPVSPPFSFRNDFDDRRPGNRKHHGTDIYAAIGQEIYAIVDGTIVALQDESYGLGIFQKGTDGDLYGYVHVKEFAAGLIKGQQVKAGALIAYSGRSGIHHSAAHLHFQAKASDGSFANPYPLFTKLLGLTGLVPNGSKIRIRHWGLV